MRVCTICEVDIPPKTQEHVIAIRSFKYYKCYNRDIAHPTVRLRHVWCPRCTDWYIKALEERVVDVNRERTERFLEEQGNQSGDSSEGGGEVRPEQGLAGISEDESSEDSDWVQDS